MTVGPTQRKMEERGSGIKMQASGRKMKARPSMTAFPETVQVLCGGQTVKQRHEFIKWG